MHPERQKGQPMYETASTASANAFGFRTVATESGDSVKAKLGKAMPEGANSQIEPPVFMLLHV